MLKFAYVAEGVRKFAEACYTLECDLYIIMSALSVFIRMEFYIENGYLTPRLDYAVDRALTLLQSVESNHDVQIKTGNTIVTVSSGKFSGMHTELTRLNGLNKEVQGGTSSQVSIRMRIENNQDNYQFYYILEQIVEARVKHKIVKAA